MHLNLYVYRFRPAKCSDEALQALHPDSLFECKASELDMVAKIINFILQFEVEILISDTTKAKNLFPPGLRKMKAEFFERVTHTPYTRAADTIPPA